MNKLIFKYNDRYINIFKFIIFSVLISRALIYLTYIFYNREYISIYDTVMQMSKWDSGWYRSIILEGYNNFPSGHPKGDAANWAFFPLYPLIIKMFYEILKIDPYIIGTVISTLFFIGAMIISYLYIVETRNDKKHAVLFIILMSFGIFSFYFSITYTESTYLFFLIMSLYFVNKEKYILAGIFGSLAGATRNMGIMIVFAVALQYTVSYLRKEDKTFKGYIVEAFQNYKLIFGVSLIPSGFFAYMTYLWYKVGDPMAFSRIEIAWGKHMSNPIKNLFNALFNSNKYELIMGIFALAAIFISIYLLINKRFAEGILGIIFIMIPLSTGMQSTGRYMIGSFVYMLGITEILSKIKNKFIIYLLIMLCSLSELVIVYYWIKGSPYLC